MALLGAERHRNTESATRFLFPILLVGIARAAIALIISFSFNGNQSFRIVSIFLAHDSGYYVNIAEFWYPRYLAPTWHIFPLYPSIVRAAFLVGGGAPVSAVIVAVGCGLISIPVFQSIAEFYFSKSHAIVATIFYFLIPPVFVFSGVAYSESLFLLGTLLAWYCHLRRDDGKVIVAAVVATLARANGVLVVIPLAHDYLTRRQFRRLLALFIPISVMLGWLTYGYLMTGQLAYFASNIFWRSQNIVLFRESLINVLEGQIYASAFIVKIGLKYLSIALGALISFMVFVVLCYKVLKIDRALGIFCFSYAAALFAFGFPATFGSFPRFLGVLFPIGLPMYTHRLTLRVLIIVGLLVLDYFAWLAFLKDGFM